MEVFGMDMRITLVSAGEGKFTYQQVGHVDTVSIVHCNIGEGKKRSPALGFDSGDVPHPMVVTVNQYSMGLVLRPGEYLLKNYQEYAGLCDAMIKGGIVELVSGSMDDAMPVVRLTKEWQEFVA
jgi:hypothetical protein